MTLTKTIEIKNKLGLHARASAKFVNHAARFASQITVKKNNQSVNGKSIMGIMMLAASKGTQLTLEIEGEDAQEMMDDLATLIENKFGEND